jgi:hypothetical protein
VKKSHVILKESKNKDRGKQCDTSDSPPVDLSPDQVVFRVGVKLACKPPTKTKYKRIEYRDKKNGDAGDRDLESRTIFREISS